MLQKRIRIAKKGGVSPDHFMTPGKHLPYISLIYYSIIVATRPDPTVRPPSRYQNSVLQGLNGYFSCVLYEKTQIFRRIRVIFEDFVIMVLSPRLNKTKYLLFHNF